MRIILTCLMALCMMSGTLGAQKQNRKCVRAGKVEPSADRVGIFTAGELAGRDLGDLYAAYVGAHHIGQKITVDPGRQLDSLWKLKVKCYPNNPTLPGVHRSLLSSYHDGRTAETLGEFVAVGDKEIRVAKEDVDWEKFQTIYHLSDAELHLTEKLSDDLSGRDFVAYGMTELMPTADGTLNLEVLEFLVRNYGPEFVYSIPAMGDRFASFGFFQFTSHALNGETREGASRASLALKRNPLPGSVADVRGKLQFRAAYLFAMHNIATMVKQLDKKEFAELSTLGDKNHDDLIQFIAAAHNAPAFAQSAARRWLDNRMRADFYVSVSNRQVRAYARKTKANLAALRSQKNLTGVLYGAR